MHEPLEKEVLQSFFAWIKKMAAFENATVTREWLHEFDREKQWLWSFFVVTIQHSVEKVETTESLWRVWNCFADKAQQRWNIRAGRCRPQPAHHFSIANFFACCRLNCSRPAPQQPRRRWSDGHLRLTSKLSTTDLYNRTVLKCHTRVARDCRHANRDDASYLRYKQWSAKKPKILHDSIFFIFSEMFYRFSPVQPTCKFATALQLLRTDRRAYVTCKNFFTTILSIEDFDQFRGIGKWMSEWNTQVTRLPNS